MTKYIPYGYRVNGEAVMAKPKGGRLKCRFCAFRAPNPTLIQRHSEAVHPHRWRVTQRKIAEVMRDKIWIY